MGSFFPACLNAPSADGIPAGRKSISRAKHEGRPEAGFALLFQGMFLSAFGANQQFSKQRRMS
jgi:hypothetical protein